MLTTVSHSYDRTPPVYAPGEEITLTVTIAPRDPDEVRGMIRTTTVVFMPDGSTSDPVVTESEYVVDAPADRVVTGAPEDSAGRAWTMLSVNQDNTEYIWKTVA